MTDIIDAASVAAIGTAMSDDRRSLLEIEDAIARIRTQIATADFARQRGGKPMDPDWYHRARTALRHLVRERSEIIARQEGRRRREHMKDAIIAILRERHDAVAWSDVLEQARMRVDGEAR